MTRSSITERITGSCWRYVPACTVYASTKQVLFLQELAGDRQQLQTAEERNATLEREVKLYNERRNMELEV